MSTRMQTGKEFWKPNLDRRGVLLRLVPGLVCILLGVGTAFWSTWWLGLLVVLIGAFMVFEAARRWCILRAFGFKTRY